MLSPFVVQVLAEVVTGGFRLGSGCQHPLGPELSPMTNDMMTLRDLVERNPIERLNGEI